ncbi:hypothetical protein THRCLA_23422 [Thraustotheca clavata]|uniref:Uncharacterized protein n=1 Tax=Thraustotheca clavata TaxID=74557 RepID=A0A1V9Y5Q2_9STRA|nr:hypothetical protein THRCLA_23422 [Thraustotheca clavata]
MFKVFKRTNVSTDNTAKPTKGIKSWFQNALKSQSKCTCLQSTRKIKLSKPKACSQAVTVTIPKKYESDRKKQAMIVSGRRTPFLPDQVNAWKKIRREYDVFAPIKEERNLCEYCLCKSDATRDSSEDDEY